MMHATAIPLFLWSLARHMIPHMSPAMFNTMFQTGTQQPMSPKIPSTREATAMEELFFGTAFLTRGGVYIPLFPFLIH